MAVLDFVHFTASCSDQSRHAPKAGVKRIIERLTRMSEVSSGIKPKTSPVTKGNVGAIPCGAGTLQGTYGRWRHRNALPIERRRDWVK
jgi:hypothetical protein